VPTARSAQNAVIVFNKANGTMGARSSTVGYGGPSSCPADSILCPKEFVLKPQIGESSNA